MKFRIKSNVFTPYKVCDIRPNIAVLFEKIIYPYDFGGYRDLDVIYGDTRLFLSYEVLRTHQVLALDQNIYVEH